MEETPNQARIELLDAAVGLMGETGRLGTLPVQGGSMLPTLQAGQTLLADLSAGRRRRGDLLVFRQDDYLVVHRLVGPAGSARRQRPLRTRGDAMLDLDPPVGLDRVRGTVIAFKDDGGWWDLRTRGARLYGLLLAWHGRCWSSLGRVATRTDALCGRLGLSTPFRKIAWRIDREGVRFTHRVFFRRLHRRADELPGDAPV